VKFLRFSVVIARTGVRAALIALASASPLDPSWIYGVYDEGDDDSVVVFIAGTLGAVELCPLAGARTVARVLALLHETDERSAPSKTVSVIHARAPPPSRASGFARSCRSATACGTSDNSTSACPL
jgi:hypothetical protein